MLELPSVTLCCIDTANHALALRALDRSCEGVRFARVLLLTDTLPAGIAASPGIDVVPIATIADREAYSHFVLKSLLPRIATPHVLLVQWDGYVVNVGAWEAGFLDCDYLGAKWFWHAEGQRVGNGGFSLRSRRLLEALQDRRIELAGRVEDETICRTFRPLLEREYGIRFADEAMADRFSFEAAYPIGRPFGFHGLFNFARTVPPAELAALAPTFSDAIARSVQIGRLLRNSVASGHWQAAAAIAHRILSADPKNDEAQRALAQAEAAMAQGPRVGRNDPCPCGSGKRYKHCHGATDGVVVATTPQPTPTASSAPDALIARAMQAHQRSELHVAEQDYRAALALAPDHPHALHYLGVLLYQRRELAAALPLLRQAVVRVPHEPEFHNNLGLALLAANYIDEAIAAHRHALRLAPDHAGAWNNLGLALKEANDLAGAIDAYRQALQIAPDFAPARWNLGLALLAQGDYAQGWSEYDGRLAIAALGKAQRPRVAPLWDGADPSGKTILLTVEQGFGDTIQFARFAQMLADRGARVIMEAHPALATLLTTAPGIGAICRSDEALPPCDAQLPLMSVAGALHIEEQSIPRAVPYLYADPRRVAAIASEPAAQGNAFKVGLGWAGNPRQANDHRRSCPLASLAPLLELPQIAWYSLQKDDGEEQIAGVAAAHSMRLLDARNNFDDKAALMNALDLVISVDSSSAHLAGALARPLWVMLCYAPDWRWHLARRDNPWYPTARLFRQPRPGDWTAVVGEIREALAAMIAERAESVVR